MYFQLFHCMQFARVPVCTRWWWKLKWNLKASFLFVWARSRPSPAFFAFVLNNSFNAAQLISSRRLFCLLALLSYHKIEMLFFLCWRVLACSLAFMHRTLDKQEFFFHFFEVAILYEFSSHIISFWPRGFYRSGSCCSFFSSLSVFFTWSFAYSLLETHFLFIFVIWHFQAHKFYSDYSKCFGFCFELDSSKVWQRH